MTSENPRRGNTAGAEVVDQFEQQQHTTPPTTFDAIAAQQSAPTNLCLRTRRNAPKAPPVAPHI